MSLSVGIHENVSFTASMNDKGTLVITAKQVQAPKTQEELDAEFAAMMAGVGSSDASEEVEVSNDGEPTQNFLLFPLQLKGYENKALVEVRSPKAIVQEIGNFRAFLTEILSKYVDINDIEWDTYRDSEYTTDNIKPSTVQTEDYLNTVYKNLASQFVSYMKQYAGDDKLFRVVFVRSSKKSHYPKLRNIGFKDAPFMESMEVPVEESKVGFTKFESDNGFDSGEQVVADQAAEDKDTSNLSGSGL